MAAAKPNTPISSARSNPMTPSNRLDERIRRYLDEHPEVSREEFLLDAVRREIHVREQWDTDHRAGPVRRGHPGVNHWSTARPAITAEDIRIHTWLNERLAVLHHERHGFWPRLRRFLFGNRLVRWLGLRPRRTEDERKRWRALFQ